MPSLLHTAVALPFSLTLLLLPPLIRFEASLAPAASPISTKHALNHLLSTILHFDRHLSSSSSSSSLWRRLSHAAHPLASHALALALTPEQRHTILNFDRNFPALLASCGLAILGCWATSWAIEKTKDVFKQRGFKGKDLLKSNQLDELPETMGLPSASVYMLLLFLFIPFRYFSSPPSHGRDVHAPLQNHVDTLLQSQPAGWEGRMDGRGGFPHHELASYLSALLSFLSAIILGFLDDVFDIRWRYKLPIPIVSSIPLLMIYYAGGGGTTVVIPGWPASLRDWIGVSILDLGPLYYVYMSLLSTFCTNSINILAGINGVEVGQALIITISLCLNDLLYLDSRAGQPGSRSSEELLRRHLFSLYFLLPLAGVCIGLLAWNRYPARVFVGDTFCYFAGMVLSSVGILGHFSKTVLLFFVPQIGNFLLSCPQLFGLVPNPRHRVPRFDPDTNSLYPSIASFSSPHTAPPNVPGQKPLKPASPLTVLILRLLEKLRLVQLDWYAPDPLRGGRRYLKSTTNLTLLNAILVLRGVKPRTETTCTTAAETQGASGDAPFDGPRISEYALWYHVMAVQIFGTLLAFSIRYRLAALVFPNH